MEVTDDELHPLYLWVRPHQKGRAYNQLVNAARFQLSMYTGRFHPLVETQEEYCKRLCGWG